MPHIITQHYVRRKAITKKRERVACDRFFSSAFSSIRCVLQFTHLLVRKQTVTRNHLFAHNISSDRAWDVLKTYWSHLITTATVNPSRSNSIYKSHTVLVIIRLNCIMSYGVHGARGIDESR